MTRWLLILVLALLCAGCADYMRNREIWNAYVNSPEYGSRRYWHTVTYGDRSVTCKTTVDAWGVSRTTDCY